MIASAFTCTGPYAVLIMLGIKRAENRSMMPTPEKGRCALGCSKSFCKEEFGNFVQWASRTLPEEDFARIPSWSDVADWPGKIVGACDYSARSRGTRDPACAAVSSKPPYQWDEGYEYWWDLSEVACFDSPIPCRGNVGMWRMPSALAEEVTVADLLARSVGEKVASAEDARRIFALAVHRAGRNEGVFVLPLDGARRVLSAPILVSLGDKATATMQPKDILSEALKAGAESIVIAHNHPSGDMTPSMADMAMTRELQDIAARLGVVLLDHLVVASAAHSAL